MAQHPISAPLQYYAECHGVIYVIDSTDEERLSESKQAFGGCGLARAGRGLGEMAGSSLHISCVWSWPCGEAGPTPGQKGPGPEKASPPERLAGTWGHQGRGRVLTATSPLPEKMVTSEALDGVPILVLANKQDIEVSPLV